MPPMSERSTLGSESLADDFNVLIQTVERERDAIFRALSAGAETIQRLEARVTALEGFLALPRHDKPLS